VHPEARGHGAAGSLLDVAARQLRDRGIRKLTLRVLGSNETAIRLYERHGFAREGIQLGEFLINGRYVDDILMAKYL
jgi:ribosomal protein S18 acetylase RimI-like enzyme